MVFSADLEKRFKQLTELKDGWDGDDAIAMNTSVLNMAYDILQKLVKDYHISEPEIGAVEDGRLDISWNHPDCFFTFDEHEVRIQTSNGQTIVQDITLEKNNQVDHLVEILKKELLCNNDHQAK